MTQNLLRKHIGAREWLSIPNQLSLLRLILIPFVLYYYLIGSVRLAVALLTFSAITDIVDGYIARRFNQVTNLGKMLDPIADKLTQFGVAICLCLAHKALIPMTLVLFIKELLMLMMGIMLLRRDQKPFSARWWGKLSTSAFYVSAIVIMLFGKSLSPAMLWAISAGVILLLIYSLIRYYNMLQNHLAGLA